MNLINFISFVCLILGLVSAARIPLHPRPCQRPRDAQLCGQWDEHIRELAHRDPESYNSETRFRNLTAGPTSQYVGYSDGDQDPSHCDLRHIRDKDSLRDRSYCPWFNVTSFDEDRYPKFVFEARCRCRYGAGSGQKTDCHEVHYNIRVLRRTEECGEDGLYVYTPEWQSVSVGCIMAKSQ